MRFDLILRMSLAASASLLCGSPAAADFRQGLEVSIEKDEVIEDDVYVCGQTVTVEGTVRGDLIVAAKAIRLHGLVEGDFIAAAQEVSIDGEVNDDARIAAQLVVLQNGAKIHDDLIVSSYTLECKEASHVSGEVRFAGYQSTFEGHIDQEAKIAAATSVLSGTFDGSIEAIITGSGQTSAGFWGIDSPPGPPGLTVTESANISGNLAYRSASEAVIDPESTIAGEVEHARLESGEGAPPTTADRAASFAKQFFALLMVGLLVVYFCPDWTRQVVGYVQQRPLASLGYGALASVVILVGSALLIVSTIAVAVVLGLLALDDLIPAFLGLGGLISALTIVGFCTYSAWIAKVIVSAWGGSRILHGRGWISKQRFHAVAVGVAIFITLTWIPLVGGAISMLVMLMGIGSTVIWLFASTRSGLPEQPVAS